MIDTRKTEIKLDDMTK